MTITDPAIAICFTVVVDGIDLGSFTTCEGLGCEITLETREEGGNNGFVHQLPGRMKYTNVKFTRPVNDQSATVAQWLASMVNPTFGRHTAMIQARRLDNTTVCSWQLFEVILARWTGPQFGVDGAKVATETRELAHHGFRPTS
jgi:phage tail-like protein